MSESTDLKSLRAVMREAISVVRLSARELEGRLGITHGALEKLLDGRQEIRLRHLLALSKVLGVSPADLLANGCPEAHRSARYKVAEWLGRPAEPAEPAAPAVPSPTELAELIRQAVREELKAQAAAPAAAELPDIGSIEDDPEPKSASSDSAEPGPKAPSSVRKQHTLVRK